MGEVYRARDPRLGREVAIKVLPAALAADADRMARFEREARLLAALNHPNIATIHGFEDADGIHAIVQELVEGPTLAERIAAGPLALDEALAVVRAIAAALESAHDRGIVHRDLKPGNVKLAPDGQVKVLDFGLARALSDEPEVSGLALSQSPTLSQRMTEAGMILGTAAYMSPEQAKGRPADRRADIWAFGVVLFEMLSGRRPFEGETASETMAAVMKDPVPWEHLPGGTPPAVRRLLERCLTRDPRQRLQAIGEARIVLEAPLDGPVAPSPAAVPRRRFTAMAIGALAILAVAGIALAVFAWRSRPPVEVRRYPLVLGSRPALLHPVISPDGRRIAFYVGDTLWVRDLVTFDLRALAPARSRVMRPVWSPDSRQLAFSDGMRLMRVPMEGGTPVPIARMPGTGGGTGASWGDQRIHLAVGVGGLYEIQVASGTLREVAGVDSSSSDYHEPVALPGGRGVVMIAHSIGSIANRLVVWDGRSTRDIYRADEGDLREACWSPSGHILFQRSGGSPGVWALPFSLRTLKPTGDAFLIAARASSPSVSRDGALLHTHGLRAASARPCWWDSARGLVPLPAGDLGDVQSSALSPDGRHLVVSVYEAAGTNLHVVDVARGTRTRLTFGEQQNWDPIWTPDGREIVFATTGLGVYAIPAHGGGTPRRLASGTIPDVGPNGMLCVSQVRHGSATDLVLVTPGDTTARTIVGGRGDQLRGVFSPDGRRLAYMSNESGQHEIYITRLPGGEGRWQVSLEGGRRPRWSRDGRRLYYQSQDGGLLWVAEIPTTGDPVPGTPRLALDASNVRLPQVRGRVWDVAADGRLLVFEVPADAAGGPDAVLVQHWAAEFAKR
jgi:serine/threonine-protein kinase